LSAAKKKKKKAFRKQKNFEQKSGETSPRLTFKSEECLKVKRKLSLGFIKRKDQNLACSQLIESKNVETKIKSKVDALVGRKKSQQMLKEVEKLTREALETTMRHQKENTRILKEIEKKQKEHAKLFKKVEKIQGGKNKAQKIQKKINQQYEDPTVVKIETLEKKKKNERNLKQ